MAYSMDLRTRVIRALEEGMTQDEASERYEVSVSAIQDWVKLNRENGTPERIRRSDDSYDSRRGIPNYKLWEFKEFVLLNNELTQSEIAVHWGISKSAVGRYLQTLKITRQKDFHLQRAFRRGKGAMKSRSKRVKYR